MKSRKTIRAMCAIPFIVGIGVAEASHFRFGHVFWTRQAGIGDVEFTVQTAWRRDAYTSCVDVRALSFIPCSGPDGFPDVGDVILETIGGTRLDPGDGSPSIGSPLGPMLLLVNSIDPVNNWLTGLGLEPDTLPNLNTKIAHIYPSIVPFTASVGGCCRIGAFGIDQHINNPDGTYRVQTRAEPFSTNFPPRTSLPPIVNCPIDALCQFAVPGVDPDVGDTITFRLEARGDFSFVQPGPPNAPNPASIDLVTGIYTWDTTGATLGADPSRNTVYSTQVVLSDGSAWTAVDFLIRLTEEDMDPPSIDPPSGSDPVCNTTQVAHIGTALIFDVAASDPDFEVVTLNVSGLPLGAYMLPSLPLSGTFVQSQFLWTPVAADVGVHVINFSATSASGGFALCPVNLQIVDQLIVDLDVGASGDEAKCVNINGNGVIPVAILGNDLDVTQVDVSTLSFGGLDVRVKGNGQPQCAIEDVNGDSLSDLICQFVDNPDDWSVDNGSVQVTGQLLDGTFFVGTDTICIVDG